MRDLFTTHSRRTYVSRLTTAASGQTYQRTERLAGHVPISGPFRSGWDYFIAVAEGFVAQALQRKRSGIGSNRFATLGPLVFRNIVRDTEIFKDSQGPFHFNHMDMGMQNILVDDDFNIVAVIDWELAQSAPWEGRVRELGYNGHQQGVRKASPSDSMDWYRRYSRALRWDYGLRSTTHSIEVKTTPSVVAKGPRPQPIA
jgi:hypothetical protein